MIDVPHHSRMNEPVDVYPLQAEGSPTVGKGPEYILVVCPVCHARMHPEASQIGRQAICPDCGTATPVRRPPPEPPKKPPRSAAEIGEYPLASEVRPDPRSVPAAKRDYVAVICSLCHTRMHATADQVGSKMICPDCGTATVVPPLPRPQPKIDVMAGADQGAYAIVGEDDPPSPRPLPPLPRPRTVWEEPPPRRKKPAEEPEEPEDDIKLPSQRPVLPDRPFLQGTFTFPFYRSVWVRTLVLVILSVVPHLLWYAAVARLATSVATVAFASAMLFAAFTVFGLMLFAFLSASVMAVLRETSEGCDEIDSWPGHAFLDWIGEPVHVFCAVCMSVVPGAAAAWLLMKLNAASVDVMWITGPVSIFIMFPIVLISTLEHNSMLGVLSLPVLRTLWTTADGWLKFYLTSGMTIAAAVGISWAASGLGLLAGSVVVAIVDPVAWLIYFRLLGRLGWVCADRAAFTDLEADLAVADDGDFDDSEDEDLLT